MFLGVTHSVVIDVQSSVVDPESISDPNDMKIYRNRQNLMSCQKICIVKLIWFLMLTKTIMSKTIAKGIY